MNHARVAVSARGVGVNDAEPLVDEDDAEGEAVERGPECRRLDGFHVEKVADGHRTPEMRGQQSQPVDLLLSDGAGRLMPVEANTSKKSSVPGYERDHSVNHPARFPFLEIAVRSPTPDPWP